MQKMYLTPSGSLWTVTDEVRKQDFKPAAPGKTSNAADTLMRKPGGG